MAGAWPASCSALCASPLRFHIMPGGCQPSIACCVFKMNSILTLLLKLHCIARADDCFPWVHCSCNTPTDDVVGLMMVIPTPFSVISMYLWDDADDDKILLQASSLGPPSKSYVAIVWSKHSIKLYVACFTQFKPQRCTSFCCRSRLPHHQTT